MWHFKRWFSNLVSSGNKLRQFFCTCVQLYNHLPNCHLCLTRRQNFQIILISSTVKIGSGWAQPLLDIRGAITFLCVHSKLHWKSVYYCSLTIIKFNSISKISRKIKKGLMLNIVYINYQGLSVCPSICKWGREGRWRIGKKQALLSIF